MTSSTIAAANSKISAVVLQRLIEDSGIKDLTWHGRYAGRGGFAGVGVDWTGEGALMQLGVILYSEGLMELADGFDHRDSMGLGMIGAWHYDRFTPTSLEEIS